MKTLNLKAVASAFAALALTVVLSWTFRRRHERRARAWRFDQPRRRGRR